jgi:4-hydroxy-tetrahydrodipicolinate synthase
MITGAILAVPAPFSESEELLPGVLARMLRHYHDAGLRSFLVNGSMGIGPLLDAATWEQVVAVAAEALEGREHCLMVNCGDTSARNTERKMRVAEANGANALIATPPYYFKLGQPELLRYFQRLADCARLPFFPYDVPGSAHNAISLETIVELARHPNVHGLKCSSPDAADMRLKLEATRDVEGFTFCCGVIGCMDSMLSLGAPACVDGIFALAPRLAVDACEAGAAGNAVECTRATMQFVRLVERMVPHGLWAAYSAGMNLLGFEGIYGISPLIAKPEQRHHDMMRALMQELDLLPATTTR